MGEYPSYHTISNGPSSTQAATAVRRPPETIPQPATTRPRPDYRPPAIRRDPTPPEGLCPDCGRSIPLTPIGRIGRHPRWVMLADGRVRLDRDNNCNGWLKTPVGNTPAADTATPVEEEEPADVDPASVQAALDGRINHTMLTQPERARVWPAYVRACNRRNEPPTDTGLARILGVGAHVAARLRNLAEPPAVPSPPDVQAGPALNRERAALLRAFDAGHVHTRRDDDGAVRHVRDSQPARRQAAGAGIETGFGWKRVAESTITELVAAGWVEPLAMPEGDTPGQWRRQLTAAGKQVLADWDGAR